MRTRHTPISKFLVFFLALAIPVIAQGSISSEALAASKAEYPTKPISMVVPFQAGGGTDVVTRMIASAIVNKVTMASAEP